MGVNDKVDVTVTRNRWYGTIIENSGLETTSKLYLFNLIALPLKSGGKSLFFMHLILLALLISSLFFINNKIKRYEFERGIM